MAYASNTLVLNASAAPGNAVYYHDAGSDTMATVAASGYFNNSDDNLNLTVDDIIFSQCGDGDFWHKVSAVSSGTVTTQLVSGEGPWNGDKSTGTGGNPLKVGVSELGTGTATDFGTPTPYPGAKVTAFQSGTGTNHTLSVSSSGVTFNEKGDTTITITGIGGGVSLLGVSTTAWAVVGGSGYSLS